MRKKPFVLCGSVCILGIFGAFIRWLQNTTAFEADTGLQKPFALWSIIMTVYLIIAAVALIFPVRGLSGESCPGSFEKAFAGKPVYLKAASWCSSVPVVVGGLVYLFRALRPLDHFDLAMGAFAVIAGICLFLLFRALASGKEKISGMISVLVVLFLCFLLVWEYKTYAFDPTIWHFGLRILATAFVLLAYYYIAGFCYGRIKPRMAAYFSFLGGALSMTTLADSAPTATHLITVGLTVGLLALMFMLIGSMEPEKPSTPSEEN